MEVLNIPQISMRFFVDKFLTNVRQFSTFFDVIVVVDVVDVVDVNDVIDRQVNDVLLFVVHSRLVM